MNFGDWLAEHFAEPHEIDEECLEMAFEAGREVCGAVADGTVRGPGKG